MHTCIILRIVGFVLPVWYASLRGAVLENGITYAETSGLTENFGESFLKSYEDLIGVH